MDGERRQYLAVALLLISLVGAAWSASVATDATAASAALTWAPRSPMPTGRSALGLVASANGRVYAMGGNPSCCTPDRAVYEYDPAIDSWRVRAAMPIARRGFGIAEAANGRVYLAGGSNGSAALADVHEYDPATDTWARKASLPTARVNLQLVAAGNGRLYAIGGQNAGGALATVEEYDPATDTWATRASLPTPRYGLGLAAADNGRLYAVGGQSATIGYVTALEEYDPATDTWATRAPMPTGRVYLPLVPGPNGRLYAIGGLTPGGWIAAVEEYNPATDAWAVSAPLAVARYDHAAVPAGNGRIYLAGGCCANAVIYLNSLEEATVPSGGNQAPSAEPGGPYSVVAGYSTTLTGAGIDPEGGPVTFAWDLDGDGLFEAAGQSVLFSASAPAGPASRPAKLRACDDQGACTVATATVNVIGNGVSLATIVPAAQPWTDTSIDVAAGQEITITATGVIRIAGSDPGKEPDGPAGPAGFPGGSGIPVSVAPPFSLVGRIGSGAGFFVGGYDRFVAPAGGRLFLGVNDALADFGDNSGAYSATVALGPLTTAPPPPPPAPPALTPPAAGTAMPRSWSAPVDLDSPSRVTNVPTVAIAPDGTVHALWFDQTSGFAPGQLIHAAQPPGGGWAARTIVGTATFDSPLVEAAVGADGTLHAAWVDFIGGQYEIKYATRAPGGAWSGIFNLSNNPRFSNRPTIAIDPHGRVVVAWEDSSQGNREILVAERSPAGVWSAAANVSRTARSSWSPVLLVTTDGTEHLVWLDYTPGAFTLLYVSRPSGGSWSTTQTIAGPGLLFTPRLAADAAGGLHLVWQERVGGPPSETARYAYRPPAGPWSQPEIIPAAGGGADIAGGAAGRAQVVMGNGSSLFVIDRLADGTWTPPSTFFTGNAGDAKVESDANGALHVVWTVGPPAHVVYARSSPGNRPPIANPCGPFTLPEGGSVSLVCSGSDPDGDPLSLAWDLDNDGTFETDEPNPTFFAVGRDGPGGQPATLRVCDDRAACATLPFTITIENVRPTPAIKGAPATSLEGTTIGLSASATDPSPADMAAGFTFAWSVTKDGIPHGPGGTGPTFAFTPDDNGSYVIALKATDKDGGEGTTSVRIAVGNVAPTVTIAGPVSGALFQIGAPVTVTGTFTDPGTADSHTAKVAFDGLIVAGTIGVGGGRGSVTATHTFAAPGVYAIKLAVTDDDGGAGEATTIGDLPAYVVVYDPNGGFVTGGGWIASPAGACRWTAACEGAVGKATFGFVSKYRPGAAVPTGQTEFHFKAGGLAFQSTAYDWLVVAGARAKYKGEGTINGQGRYGFMLSAIDGQVQGGGGTDKFRVKIWDKNDGDRVVYDNQLGSDEHADPTTVLGGGSIVVHKE